MLEDGSLNPAMWIDSNLFNVKSITAVAGFSNPTRGREQLFSDPRFHYHPVRDMGGHLVTVVTHQMSAEWMGAVIREENEARRLANLKQNQSIRTYAP